MHRMSLSAIVTATTLVSVVTAAPSACVTGAGGFVATEIIYQLLELGWEVHGTARNLNQTEKYDFLNTIAEKFADKGGKLVMHEADLLVSGSFDECVIGRDYLFHPATIFSVVEDDPYRYYDMAVTGSKNVLNSVLKSHETDHPIKKTVATMSLISVYNFCGLAIKCPKTQKPKNGESFNEEDWAHALVPDGGVAYTTQPFEGYARSKLDQDRFTREFCIVNNLECATVHPSLIIGPPRGTRVSGVSMGTIAAMSKGASWGNIFIMGDNRDVAETHIKAAITPGANGRYIVSNAEQDSNKEMAECLQNRFPGIALAEHDNSDVRAAVKVSAKLTEELLGRKLRSHCQAWGDAVEGFFEAGLTKNPGLHGKEEL